MPPEDNAGDVRAVLAGERSSARTTPQDVVLGEVRAREDRMRAIDRAVEEGDSDLGMPQRPRPQRRQAGDALD